MRARGIPEQLLRWTRAFCSERTATIQVNGQSSEIQNLPQAGLPQGSPLSPILFLFFNADLVQRRIDSRRGAIAFVDDFTAWAMGPTAQSNREGIEAIIKDALDWRKEAGRPSRRRRRLSYTLQAKRTRAPQSLLSSRGKPSNRESTSRSSADHGHQAQVQRAYGEGSV
jgi:hypothetical protein